MTGVLTQFRLLLRDKFVNVTNSHRVGTNFAPSAAALSQHRNRWNVDAVGLAKF